MRVIFLDVDGVLNHSACPDWQTTHHVIDPDCARRVVNVCKRTGARIVMSSSWRGNPDAMRVVLGALGDLVIGVTPYINRMKQGLYDAVPRRDEIAAWITQHVGLPLETVAIDDDADAEIPGLPFVRTDFERGGFTLEKAHETLAHFEVRGTESP